MKAKRLNTIKRRKKLIAKSQLKRSTKAIPKKNIKATKNKHARYSKFIMSPEWKAIRDVALGLANYTCQAAEHHPDCERDVLLTVHHKTYARFGGRELQSDLQVLSRPCHDMEEAKKPGIRLWQRAAGYR